MTDSRLIHLNGIPGCGKSTIGSLYASHYPGSLVLDVDDIVPTLDGWTVDFFAAFDVARGLAATEAQRVLSAGRDVVLPQMITNQGESDDFELAAAAACAEYVQIVIDVDPAEAMARIAQRHRRDSELNRIIRDVIRSHGDVEFLHKLRLQLDRHVATKPLRGRFDATRMSIEDAHTAVVRALGASNPFGRHAAE